MSGKIEKTTKAKVIFAPVLKSASSIFQRIKKANKFAIIIKSIVSNFLVIKTCKKILLENTRSII
jgi:hypothetical protein